MNRVPGPRNGAGGPGSGEGEGDAQSVRNKSKNDLVADRPPEPAAETCELELIEEESPAPLDVLEDYPPPQSAPGLRQSGAKAPPVLNDAIADEERERPRKRRKRKKIREPEDNTGMAAIYLGQTREEFVLRSEEMRKKRMRKELGGDHGDDDDGDEDAWFTAWSNWLDGVTLFGVHFTPGVAVGAVMLVTGMMCLALIGVNHWSAWTVAPPKVIFAAIVYTLVGAFLLARSLIFGTED
jgi:hypothetical protein